MRTAVNTPWADPDMRMICSFRSEEEYGKGGGRAWIRMFVDCNWARCLNIQISTSSLFLIPVPKT